MPRLSWCACACACAISDLRAAPSVATASPAPHATSSECAAASLLSAAPRPRPQLNLAALGYAPATLVTPLGCLTVVFNAVAAAVMLREPFLRRDALGIFFIFVGVLCVVCSSVGAPAPPITPDMLRYHTFRSSRFWILVGGVPLALLTLYLCVHEQYAHVTCWVYLAESSLVSTFTVVSARVFASFLPSPMPGSARYFFTSPDCFLAWGALGVLAVSAVGGLLLQNAALMHFKASEGARRSPTPAGWRPLASPPLPFPPAAWDPKRRHRAQCGARAPALLYMCARPRMPRARPSGARLLRHVRPGRRGRVWLGLRGARDAVGAAADPRGGDVHLGRVLHFASTR